MTESSSDKLRVLVVDDDKAWLQGIQTQSERLSRSRLAIRTSDSFGAGLRFLKSDKQVDVVVVDYYLDNSHLALEFIEKARGMGLTVPFVIISAATRDGLHGLNETSTTDFIEKTEIRNFADFQDKILHSHRRFRETVVAALTFYFSAHRNLLDNMRIISCEVKQLHKTVRSYEAKIADQSFHNICAAIEGDMEELVIYIERATELIPDYPGLNERRPLLDAFEMQTEPVRTGRRVAATDRVPYSRHRRRIVKWLSDCERRILDAKTDKKELQRLIGGLLKKEEQSEVRFAEVVVLHWADLFVQRGNIDLAVDLLFYLSQAFEQRRQNKRVASTDMLAASYLLEQGRYKQAATYAVAAKKLAVRLRDEDMIDAFETLTSLH